MAESIVFVSFCALIVALWAAAAWVVVRDKRRRMTLAEQMAAKWAREEARIW